MQAHANDLRAEIGKDWSALTGDAAATADDAAFDTFTHTAVRDWTSLTATPAVMTLLEYASKITKTPAACNQEDIDRLREVGWSDSAIHDAVQIASYFNYINRIADALGVEPEPDFRSWGINR